MASITSVNRCHVVKPACTSKLCCLWKPSTARRGFHVARALAEESKVVYQGRFGPWSIEPEDVREVWGYRLGLSVLAAGAAATSCLALLPPESIAQGSTAVQGNSLQSILLAAADPACILGALGLGVSLQLIHIYISPLKKALQAFWLLGTLGGLYLMATQDMPVALYVAYNPAAVWLVGPLFAALTGVAFKEGFCYGKWEAGGLFGVTPLLLLGHLTQVVPPEGERGMLAAMVLMLAIFAGRKYTQPIKDDIGDKSVFGFMSKSAEEQQRLLQDGQ